MTRAIKARQADHAIHPVFTRRWSARAMSGAPIPKDELMLLFEAARWAPSAYNNQPWRILYAQRDTPAWPTFFNLLVDFNKQWAQNAAALVLFISKRTFDHNGEPSYTHTYDTGAAWQNLALQGTMHGYVTRGMEGFDYELARYALQIPEAFRIEAMAAIGKPGRSEDLSPELLALESPTQRRQLASTVCEGKFRFD
jgi:nitroreductase